MTVSELKNFLGLCKSESEIVVRIITADGVYTETVFKVEEVLDSSRYQGSIMLTLDISD